MINLENKIALVTGASRGIGQSIAKTLASCGAKVIGTATSDAGAEKITEYLAEYGGQGSVLNVQDNESINTLMKQLDEASLTPQILVNNAGITRDQLLMRMSDEEWDTVIQTNLSSIYRMSKACLRPMMKARFGRIITIGSIVGSMGNAGQTNYAAAKAGLIGFSKSLAREIASRGVTVNVIAPGFIDTDMTRALKEEQRNALAQQIPMQKLGQVEDIAAAAAFLACDLAGYITGETLHVNGGFYMG